MKKTATILVTLAILGLVGIMEKSQSSAHQLVSPTQTSAATTSSQSSNTSSSSGMGHGQGMMSSMKDGTFTGDAQYTPYGPVQISIVVSSGKITDVNFLQMPTDLNESYRRTVYSEPLLKQTTLDKQSANIDFVSGATSTSEGYQMSLQSALNQAG